MDLSPPGIGTSINALRISSPELSPNPWVDETSERVPSPAPSFDPTKLNLESAVTASFLSPQDDDDQNTLSRGVELDAQLQGEILNQFDPLADREESEAREAWKNSEGHLPPRSDSPRSESPHPPQPPAKDVAPSRPPSSSSFPSLAALARTFAITSLPKSRPLSMDSARPVPSPSTLGSFASQQSKPKKSIDSGTASPSVRSSLPGSGSASPMPETRSENEQDKDKDLSFDFQKFLDQMKLKGAEPVAKYLRSFLSNFAKRTFTVNDQVKIINDFLIFISVRMRESDIWKNASDAEFENAMEGMEKLVMNRLYDFIFTPQILRAIPPRPITCDDLERDRVLSQRIALFGWVEEKHLEVPEGEGSKGFLMFAQQELLKINHYKAPRDKLICILNCCKVIFGLIRHLHKEEGADSFVPILIFVVLKANPDHLLSNVEFISRFRNPAKLQSEAGYYLSSLMGAVAFIETMDHTSVSDISQEEFEKNVEEAIQSLPSEETHSPPLSAQPVMPTTPTRISSLPQRRPPPSHQSQSQQSPHAGEESASPLSLPAPTITDDARRLLQKTGDTISKPLSAIGRIVSEALDGAEGKLTYLPGPFAPFELGRERRAEETAGDGGQQPQPHWGPDQIRPTHPQYESIVPQTPAGEAGVAMPTTPVQAPYKARVRKFPPVPLNIPESPGWSPEDTPSRVGPYTNQQLYLGPSQPHPRLHSLTTTPQTLSRAPTPSLEILAVQAQIDAVAAREEAEAEEARMTLGQMFPGVDGEVVGWVLEANQGDLGKSIEALLEMADGG